MSSPPSLLPVTGIRWGTASAGIRRSKRDDIAILDCSPGTQTAVVFTQNRFQAAPVRLARMNLNKTSPRALIVNSGCANAGTGERGYRDAWRVCEAAARALGISAEEVLPFSTGVIGELLPVEAMVEAVEPCAGNLRADAWLDAAHAIMTTDTMPKGVSVRTELHGRAVTVTGIAKGAGMIRPDMATMLAFIATDASVRREVLDSCLRQAVARSFNRITVDGDTSTNDACVLLATGAAGHPEIARTDDAAYPQLAQAVQSAATALAHAIVRDAEGGTKFVEIAVSGGATEKDCLQVAYTVAHSPLVKTAFYASDANWGRILAAVGRAVVPTLDIQHVSIHINDQPIVHNGDVAPSYNEAAGQAVMAQEDLRVCIDLGAGDKREVIWTCDLSTEYVRINAEYRT